MFNSLVINIWSFYRKNIVTKYHLCKEWCYSHDGRVWWRVFPILMTVVLYTFARGRTVSNPEINLNINFKAQNRKTKTDTNPIPDPNR